MSSTTNNAGGHFQGPDAPGPAEEAGSGSVASSVWRILKFVLKFVLAGGVMYWLLSRHWSSSAEALRSFDPRFLLLAIFLYAVHIVANAWRWWLLLKVQEIACGLFDAVSLTMQSFFFSLVIPGGALGGDLVRAGFLAARVPKGRKFDGAFSILMDRFTGMLGIFLFALALLPFSWWAISRCEGLIETLVKIVILGCVAGLASAVVVFQHRRLERIPLFLRCKELGDRLTHGLPSKVADSLDTYAGRPGAIAICVLASVLFVNLILGLTAYSLLLGAGAQAPSPSLVLAAMTIGNIVGLLPLTPSGVGARDIFVIAILEAGGVPAGQATATSLAMTALILGYNLFGGVFFLLPDGRASGPRRRPDLD